jgi:hypothetical protein
MRSLVHVSRRERFDAEVAEEFAEDAKASVLNGAQRHYQFARRGFYGASRRQ